MVPRAFTAARPRPAGPPSRTLGGRAKLLIILLSLVASELANFRVRAADSTQVEFNRDIRPILADACYQCHGPDSAKRKANLRLDTEAGAFAKRAKAKLVRSTTHLSPSKRSMACHMMKLVGALNLES